MDQQVDPDRKQNSEETNLVDKDDTRRVLAGHPEHVPHHPRALAEVLLHKLGAVDADEGSRRVVRDRLDEHRLAGTCVRRGRGAGVSEAGDGAAKWGRRKRVDAPGGP